MGAVGGTSEGVGCRRNEKSHPQVICCRATRRVFQSATKNQCERQTTPAPSSIDAPAAPFSLAATARRDPLVRRPGERVLLRRMMTSAGRLVPRRRRIFERRRFKRRGSNRARPVVKARVNYSRDSSRCDGARKQSRRPRPSAGDKPARCPPSR